MICRWTRLRSKTFLSAKIYQDDCVTWKFDNIRWILTFLFLCISAIPILLLLKGLNREKIIYKESKKKKKFKLFLLNMYIFQCSCLFICLCLPAFSKLAFFPNIYFFCSILLFTQSLWILLLLSHLTHAISTFPISSYLLPLPISMVGSSLFSSQAYFLSILYISLP